MIGRSLPLQGQKKNASGEARVFLKTVMMEDYWGLSARMRRALRFGGKPSAPGR
jgi:hypothetical protein